MANTNNSTQPLETVNQSPAGDNDMIKDCEQHEADSYSWLSTIRKDWDQKESILLGYQPEDTYAKFSKSKVVDQSLSSMIMERASRVIATLPSIQAYADAKNSVGRTMLMNIALRSFQEKAEEEGSHLLKLRFFDIYSHVYGSMFGLVPWRVNKLRSYVGPELLPIAIRDIRPQPGRRTQDKMDWFTVRSKVTVPWLKQQDPGTWKNIDAVLAEYKERKDTGASSRSTAEQTTSYVERMRFPTLRGDKLYPDIELFTEYRGDKWITWAPRNVQNKNSKPWILRIVKGPYIDGLLPIVVKHAFPLMDSIIGLGDIERGKTLQFAKNSLINMYMDGVKMTLFPPLHINLDNVDPGSIKWGAAEKWYMKTPNVDVQVMALRTTEWISTFQSTYGFLTTLIQNLSGTTTISETPGADPTLGKTPDAISQYAANQNARDAWDTFMMEDFVRQIYSRWGHLIGEKMSVAQSFKVWGSEIQDLQKEFPEEDILSVFSEGQRGTVTFDKSLLHAQEPVMDPQTGTPQIDPETQQQVTQTKKVIYSFDIEPDSMSKNTHTDENEVATSVLQDFAGQNGEMLLAEMKAQGKTIDFSELYKRKLIAGGFKDWDKVIIDDPNKPQQGGQQQQAKESVMINYKDAPSDVQRQMEAEAGFQPSQLVSSDQIASNVAQSQGMQPQVQARPDLPVDNKGTKDPAIAQMLAEVMGGMSGIPPQNGNGNVQPVGTAPMAAPAGQGSGGIVK